MKLILEQGERPILLTKLGLAAKASNAEITAAVTERLTGTASPPSAASWTPDAHDLIAAAVADERIPRSRADFYAQRFADDPDGTAKVLAKLQPGSAHYANEDAAAAVSAAPPEGYPREWLPESGARSSRVTVE